MTLADYLDDCELGLLEALPKGRKKMTNKDIDELIATEVMGWEKREAYFQMYKNEYWFDGNERIIVAVFWHPSTNIAHAWQVVEKMRDKGYVFIIQNPVLNWHCEIGINNIWFEAEDHETSLAICKAALWWIGDNDKEGLEVV